MSKARMAVVTHTVTMVIRLDPIVDEEDQLREIEANCEAAADYAYGEGRYTQDTEASVVVFTESVKSDLLPH